MRTYLWMKTLIWGHKWLKTLQCPFKKCIIYYIVMYYIVYYHEESNFPQGQNLNLKSRIWENKLELIGFGRTFCPECRWGWPSDLLDYAFSSEVEPRWPPGQYGQWMSRRRGGCVLACWWHHFLSPAPGGGGASIRGSSTASPRLLRTGAVPGSIQVWEDHTH